MTIEIKEYYSLDNVPNFHIHIGDGVIYIKPNLALAIEHIERVTGTSIMSYNVYFIDMGDHLNITLIYNSKGAENG